MKQSKHNLHSTRFRTPYESEYISANQVNSHNISPSKKYNQQRDFYSVQQLESILADQRSQSYNRQSNEQRSPQKLTCVCPGQNIQQNDIHMYALLKRNNYLEKKISGMKQIFYKQQQRLDNINSYTNNHSNCEKDCYKDKYFELLKNVEPK